MTRNGAAPRSAPPSPVGKRDYALGFLTAAILAFMAFLFLGYLVGFSSVYDRVRERFTGEDESESAVHLPRDVLQELTALNAVVSNAGNPTNQPKHDTMLVRPHDTMGYVLRPGARIEAHLLATRLAFNWDPPVLYLKEGSPLSPRLRTFIRENARLSYGYTVSRDGFRSTLPAVRGDRRVLVVGDSVAFGVGVDDKDTLASCLQRLTGERVRIVNAAVGGYDGASAFETADRLSEARDFWGLIYVACQNDFVHEGEDWTVEAEDVLKRFKALSKRFENRVAVCLHTYMEYNLRDVFLDRGWSDAWLEQTQALRVRMPELCAAYGFEYVDWSRLVEDFSRAEGSVFSRFALYCDHAHLSPRGNRLIADALYRCLGTWSQEQAAAQRGGE